MARRDFLDITTAIPSLQSLEIEHYNIALAYDLDFNVPDVEFVNGAPYLKHIDGNVVSCYSYYDGTEWDRSFIAIEQKELMNDGVGPTMPYNLATVYACNFNKLPCCHQIKRFGDWLHSINSGMNSYYRFDVIVSNEHNKQTVYYKAIKCGLDKKSIVSKALKLIQKADGELTRGFVAALTIYDTKLVPIEVIVCVGDTIYNAWRSVYSNTDSFCKYLYRTDGGINESKVYYILRRMIRAAKKPSSG